MIRKIVKIDEEKCNGCGACAHACHEDAIGIIHGKAVLLRDDYCDGLGNCLPVCPMNAISFEEREAASNTDDWGKLLFVWIVGFEKDICRNWFDRRDIFFYEWK